MQNKQNNKVGSFIVSWDFTRDNDTDILLVGNQSNGKMTVMNAFQGEEAHDIYNALTMIKNRGELNDE